jgi:hypothetical protein
MILAILANDHDGSLICLRSALDPASTAANGCHLHARRLFAETTNNCFARKFPDHHWTMNG